MPSTIETVIQRTNDPDTHEIWTQVGNEKSLRPPEVFDWPVVITLTDEEIADEQLSRVWTLELYREVVKRTPDGEMKTRKWVSAADFQRGATVNIDDAIKEIKKRQRMSPRSIYRIRNLRDGAVILGSVL